jgi:hypothetical protein
LKAEAKKNILIFILYKKIKPVRCRGGGRRGGGRRGFRPPLFWNSVKKNLKKFGKKSILKQVVVCWCAVYTSEKFEKNKS